MLRYLALVVALIVLVLLVWFGVELNPKEPKKPLAGKAWKICKEPNRTKSSKLEQAVRDALELRYPGYTFDPLWPEFLRNPKTGRCLELDCCNEELRIAAEVQGPHHTKWPNWTGQTREQFLKQQARDKFKVDRCRQEGVVLLVVPSLPRKKIGPWVNKELDRLGV